MTTHINISLDLDDPRTPDVVRALVGDPPPLAPEQEAPAPKPTTRGPKAAKQKTSKEPEPEKAVEVTLPELRKAALAKSEELGEDGQKQVFAVIEAHGGTNFKDLAKNAYGDCLTDIEAL